jgi:hypothetical protein
MIHNTCELEYYKENTQYDTKNYVVVSPLSVPCDNVLTPITNKIRDLTIASVPSPIFVIKIGWVLEDIEDYKKVLQLSNVRLVVFTRFKSTILTKLCQQYNIDVYINEPTSKIIQFIQERGVKFVINPKNAMYWSGSIPFALDNNMILLTQKAVIKHHGIPDAYCMAYDDDSFNETSLYVKYTMTQDKNVLQTFKNKVAYQNSNVINKLLASRYENNGSQSLSGQDKFVLSVLNHKKNGFFV